MHERFNTALRECVVAAKYVAVEQLSAFLKKVFIALQLCWQVASVGERKEGTDKMSSAEQSFPPLGLFQDLYKRERIQVVEKRRSHTRPTHVARTLASGKS